MLAAIGNDRYGSFPAVEYTTRRTAAFGQKRTFKWTETVLLDGAITLQSEGLVMLSVSRRLAMALRPVTASRCSTSIEKRTLKKPLLFGVSSKKYKSPAAQRNTNDL